ncbi:MAG: hypothetical protein KGS61_18330, partial [Verrucomicrobia bacterium]|nr:hypothetical protein [Verrucomicrobiota bacterium]
FSPHVVRLAALLQTARIRRIGPVEFQMPPTPGIVAAATAGGATPALVSTPPIPEGHTVRIPQGPEILAFNQLNQFFVLRSKVLLAVLAHSQGMTISDFSQLARSFGVPQENLETTLRAFLQTGCAQFVEDNKKVMPTAWGQRYVQVGLHLA